jgi:hypothetical protein
MNSPFDKIYYLARVLKNFVKEYEGFNFKEIKNFTEK